MFSACGAMRNRALQAKSFRLRRDRGLTALLMQEIGKFLSREFQDNIAAFEQKIEPKLGVSRARAALSMAVLTQIITAAIAMLVGFAVFRDRAWSVYEILQATLSLVLIVILFNRFLPFLFFCDCCCTQHQCDQVTK